MASSSSRSSSSSLPRTPARSGQSKPMREAFSVSRSARSRAGAAVGTPSSTEPCRPVFFLRSSAFSLRPVLEHLLGART